MYRGQAIHWGTLVVLQRRLTITEQAWHFVLLFFFLCLLLLRLAIVQSTTKWSQHFMIIAFFSFRFSVIMCLADTLLNM